LFNGCVVVVTLRWLFTPTVTLLLLPTLTLPHTLLVERYVVCWLVRYVHICYPGGSIPRCWLRTVTFADLIIFPIWFLLHTDVRLLHGDCPVVSHTHSPRYVYILVALMYVTVDLRLRLTLTLVTFDVVCCLVTTLDAYAHGSHTHTTTVIYGYAHVAAHHVYRGLLPHTVVTVAVTFTRLHTHTRYVATPFTRVTTHALRLVTVHTSVTLSVTRYGCHTLVGYTRGYAPHGSPVTVWLPTPHVGYLFGTLFTRYTHAFPCGWLLRSTFPVGYVTFGYGCVTLHTHGYVTAHARLRLRTHICGWLDGYTHWFPFTTTVGLHGWLNHVVVGYHVYGCVTVTVHITGRSPHRLRGLPTLDTGYTVTHVCCRYTRLIWWLPVGWFTRPVATRLHTRFTTRCGFPLLVYPFTRVYGWLHRFLPTTVLPRYGYTLVTAFTGCWVARCTVTHRLVGLPVYLLHGCWTVDFARCTVVTVARYRLDTHTRLPVTFTRVYVTHAVAFTLLLRYYVWVTGRLLPFVHGYVTTLVG